MKASMATPTKTKAEQQHDRRKRLLARSDSAPLPPHPEQLPYEDYEKREMEKDASMVHACAH